MGDTDESTFNMAANSVYDGSSLCGTKSLKFIRWEPEAIDYKKWNSDMIYEF